MNETIKSSLIFVAGVAVGTAVTYFTIKKQFEEKLKENTEASHDFWKRYYENNQPKKDETDISKEVSKEQAAEDAVKEAASIIPESTKQKEVYAPVNTSAVDYTKCFNAPVDPAEKEFPSEESVAREPYEIDEEKYENPGARYSQVVLHYFEEDDTYVDKNNDPLLDDEALYPDMLGRVPLSDASDKAVYFVMSEQHGYVFKVYVYHNSYQNYIGG